jgi:hypothetical protein
MMLRLVLTAFLAATICPGCAVWQAHRDQDQIRSALLDLYTNQIMDNLARASKGLPIIQLDYTNAQGMITAQGTANFSDTNTVTRPAVTTFMASLGLQNTNQVTLSATPVTTSNEVYDAYIEFLTIPGSLIVSQAPPPPHAAHICRQYGNSYYWVPVEFAGDFFKLSLLTTAQRGQRLLPADAFFQVTIVDVREPMPDPQNRAEATLVTIVLDKTIPNDNGYIEIADDKKEKRRDFNEYETLQPDGSTFQPSDTNRFRLALANSEVNEFRGFLAGGKTARIYLQHRRPEAPNTDDLLQRANFQLHQINQNLVRQPSR